MGEVTQPGEVSVVGGLTCAAPHPECLGKSPVWLRFKRNQIAVPPTLRYESGVALPASKMHRNMWKCSIFQIKNHVHRISTGRIFTEIKARPGGAAPEKPRLVRHNLTPVGLCTNGSRGGRFTPTEGGCSSTRLSPTAAGLSERREDALRSGRAGTVPGGPPLPPLEPRAHARSGDWWN